MRNEIVIPAQARIQGSKRRSWFWTPAFAGVTRMALLGGLVVAGAIALPAPNAHALVWKDCQRIAMCTGCAPRYRCRACEYKRTCQGGVCGWGDVCVWGPYVKVLPRGARIIQ